MDQRAASERPLPSCVEALKMNRLLHKPSQGMSRKLHANLNVYLMCVTDPPADMHKPLTCATGMSDRPQIGGSPPPSLSPFSEHVISLTRPLPPQYCCYRYWQVIQRLVLIGWTDDARDLLYVHSETQSTEDRQSMQAEVPQLLCCCLCAHSVLLFRKSSSVYQCFVFDSTPSQ